MGCPSPPAPRCGCRFLPDLTSRRSGEVARCSLGRGFPHSEVAAARGIFARRTAACFGPGMGLRALRADRRFGQQHQASQRPRSEEEVVAWARAGRDWNHVIDARVAGPASIGSRELVCHLRARLEVKLAERRVGHLETGPANAGPAPVGRVRRDVGVNAKLTDAAFAVVSPKVMAAVMEVVDVTFPWPTPGIVTCSSPPMLNVALCVFDQFDVTVTRPRALGPRGSRRDRQ